MSAAAALADAATALEACKQSTQRAIEAVSQPPQTDAALESLGAVTPDQRHPGLVSKLRFFLGHKDALSSLLTKVNGRTVVLLHGTTSCGKSTFTLRLKTTFPASEFKQQVIAETNKMVDAGDTQFFETDDGTTIEVGSNQPQGTTIIPNIVDVGEELGEAVTVLDMPGLSDQDELHQFVIGVVYRLIMQDLQNCVLASLVGASSLLMPALQNGWRDQCLQSLHMILGDDMEHFRTGMGFVTFVVNHFDGLKPRQRKKLKMTGEYAEKKSTLHSKLMNIVARAVSAPEDCLALYQSLAANFMLVDYSEDEPDDIVGRFRGMLDKALRRNGVAVSRVTTFSLAGSEEAVRCRDVLSGVAEVQVQVRESVEAILQHAADAVQLFEDLVTLREAILEHRRTALEELDNVRFKQIITSMKVASAPLTDKISEIATARDRLENIVGTAHFLKLEAAKQSPLVRCAIIRSTPLGGMFAAGWHEVDASVDVAQAIFKGQVCFINHDSDLESRLRNSVCTMADVAGLVDELGQRHKVLRNTVTPNGHPDDPGLKQKQVRWVNADPCCQQAKLQFQAEFTLVVVYEVASSGTTAGFFEDLLDGEETHYRSLVADFKSTSGDLTQLRKQREQLSAERVKIIDNAEQDTESLMDMAGLAHASAGGLFQEAELLLERFGRMFSQGGQLGMCGQFLAFMKQHVLRTPQTEVDEDPVNMGGDNGGDGGGAAASNRETFGGKQWKAPSKKMLAEALEFTEEDFDGIDVGTLPVTQEQLDSYEHAVAVALKQKVDAMKTKYHQKFAEVQQALQVPIEVPTEEPSLPHGFSQVQDITEEWDEQKKRIINW